MVHYMHTDRFLVALHDATGGAAGLLDARLLLAIASSPDQGKTDYVERLLGSRDGSKSALDRPVRHLLDAGLIEVVDRPGAFTQRGDARRHYRLSVLGRALVESSGVAVDAPLA